MTCSQLLASSFFLLLLSLTVATLPLIPKLAKGHCFCALKSLDDADMELKTVIYYRNAYAHFVVTREYKGVYCAELVQYDGFAEQAPPPCVILVRGERKWWGSVANDELIHLLSDAILALPESDLFYRERNNASESAEEAS